MTPEGDVDASVEIKTAEGIPVWKWVPKLREGNIDDLVLTTEELENILFNSVHAAVLRRIPQPGDRVVFKIGDKITENEFQLQAGMLIWWEPAGDPDERLKEARQFFGLEPKDGHEEGGEKVSYPPPIEHFDLDLPEHEFEDPDEDSFGLFEGQDWHG